MPKAAKSEKIMFYGTGRRKKSIARVRLVEGKGNIIINGKPMDEYFGLETLKVIVKQPLTATNTLEKYDVICKVTGGGFTDINFILNYHKAVPVLMIIALIVTVVMIKKGNLKRLPLFML